VRVLNVRVLALLSAAFYSVMKQTEKTFGFA